MITERSNTIKKYRIALIAILVMMFVVVGVVPTNALTLAKSTAKVDADGGVYLRKSTSTSSDIVATIADNTKVTLKREVFTSAKNTKATTRWYYVSVSGKKGYIRSDCLDTFKYATTKVKTTDNLNYRTGPNSDMKLVGAFDGGEVIKAVLTAKLKGNDTTWYKIKKGSKYYYVSGKYITAVSTNKKTTTAKATAPAVKEETTPVVFDVTDLVYPKVIYTNVPFSVSGKITCNEEITKVVVGVVNSSNNWTLKETVDVNSKEFDISTVDGRLKFGSLPVGNYTYKANFYVNGKAYTQVKKYFIVKKAVIPAKITKTAIALAWPKGTAKKYYKYSGGAPSEAYKKALDEAFPTHNKWSGAAKKGASCDVFVGTTMRASGYDPTFPRGVDEDWSYLEKSDKWTKVSYTGNESQLQSGDIIIYKRPSGRQHICIYVKISGTGYLAEAQISKYYGFINSGLNKVKKFSDKKKLYVYRATQ